MSNLSTWDVLRTAGENAFEAVVLAATCLYVVGATISMCLAV
jgi:hypothetical protein